MYFCLKYLEHRYKTASRATKKIVDFLKSKSSILFVLFLIECEEMCIKLEGYKTKLYMLHG